MPDGNCRFQFVKSANQVNTIDLHAPELKSLQSELGKHYDRFKQAENTFPLITWRPSIPLTPELDKLLEELNLKSFLPSPQIKNVDTSRQNVESNRVAYNSTQQPDESSSRSFYSAQKQRLSNIRSKEALIDLSDENVRKPKPMHDEIPEETVSPFVTAKQKLNQDNKQGNDNVAPNKKRICSNRRGFVSPMINGDAEEKKENDMYNLSGSKKILKGKKAPSKNEECDENIDPRLKAIDPKIVELIENEIMDLESSLGWDDIAGLEHAKKTIKEIVVWPMLRPDIFKGLRGPPKGILLFGPPGTGKTLIGKCIANNAKATFFSISASSLTSKWVGEGEKMVRALFAVARVRQPSVVFIDEIDSLLTHRTDGEVEASRRIKTEFLVQFDGAGTDSNDRILIIGATNRPQEIDEAARRRLVKRLYLALPDGPARMAIVINLLKSQNHNLDTNDMKILCDKTDGYSGSDMANLCREAALGPIRSIEDIQNISEDQVRPITLNDFIHALSQVRASVSDKDLAIYEQWNKDYGSMS